MSGIEAVVGVIGTVLTINSAIDLCIQYGKDLEAKIKLFMHAEEQTTLQTFVVSLVAGGLHDMLSFFRDSEHLDESFSNQLRDLTRYLQNALLKAIEAFPKDSSEAKKGKLSKVKYAYYDKKRIDEASEEMEIWHDRFRKRADIYLTYVLRPRLEKLSISKPENSASPIERLQRIREARRRVKGPLLITDAGTTEYMEIKNSPLWAPRTTDSNLSTVLEYRNYEGADKTSIDKTRLAIRNIALKLREVDESSMGILQCRGFSEQPANDRFALHFSVPPTKENPRSLRTLLADPGNKEKGKRHSLSDRVRLARGIASAVLYVHSSEFVHKNIRPENIILFDRRLEGLSTTEREKRLYPFALGEPYLVGYEGARKEDAESRLAQVTQWEKRLYLSPERQTADVVKFTMKHDVYSLGVVLLEIGLWEDFTDSRSSVGKALKSASQDPAKVLGLLMQLSKRIPILLGDKYYSAVVSCLQELKEEQESHVLDDEDGIVIGTAYMSQVMSKLEQISV